MNIKPLQFFLVLVALLVLAIGCTAEENASAAKKEIKLETPKERISYTIGVNIGRDFVNQKMDIDTEVLLAGLRDVMQEKDIRMTEEEMMAEVQAFQQEMQAAAEAEMKKAADENLQKGQAFLAENGKKEGVVTTESGLQYKVVEPGEGASPTPEDVVTVHYRGTLIDGTQFDSSIDRGQPATFPVSGVIPGWTEALQLMKPGAKFELAIPSELAYGPRGAGQDIGPNAALLFDVELIAIEKE